MRGLLFLAEKLGMPAEELAGRMSAEEYRLWQAEYLLRDEERRDAEMEARAKMRAHRG